MNELGYNIAEKVILEHYKEENFHHDSREQKYVEMRAVLQYVLKNVYGFSYGSIGRRYHFNHSTIIHNVRRIKEQAQYDKVLNENLTNVIATLHQRD